MAARTELDRLMAMDRGEGQEETQGDSSWDANQINQHVYLGSEEAAHASKQEIASRGISHILVLKLVDLPICPLAGHLSQSIEFIRAAVSSGGKVLVHCSRGVSRSAAITCAYLMKEQAISFVEANHLIRSKRPCVSINAGFQKELASLDLDQI